MSKVIFRQVLIDKFAVQDEFPVSNINLTNILQTQGRRKHCKIRGAQQLRRGGGAFQLDKRKPGKTKALRAV